MKLGYARVSTTGQDLQSQIDKLKEEGCEVIYSEKITGTNANRTEFQRLLADDYCGTIAPSGRILAPLKAEKKPISAEAAPLIFIKGNRKNQRKYGFKP